MSWMMMRAMILAACSFLAIAAAADEFAEAAPITVITYNVRYANPGDGPDVWPHRVDAVAGVIARGDIIGLQEVTHGQLVDLQQRLDGFEYCGVARDDGKQQGEYSPIFYRGDRFEAIDQGTFWLSESPAEVGSVGWDAALPRICSWIFLRDRRSGASFWFANTHFDHVGQLARLESGKLLREMANERGNQQPLIVVGDFNCLPQSEPYLAMLAAGSATTLLDARQRTEPQGPRSTWNGFREIVPDRVIDHIFTTESVVVESLTTLDPKTSAGRFASDHLPVMASVHVKSGS